LKKAAQKLLLSWPSALSLTVPMASIKQSFFASFCSQKEAFSLSPARKLAFASSVRQTWMTNR